ncbi:Uridine kinase-like protein 1 [Carex littledalei]|uniref:Uridine kinase-like protein 1 n=1 Tax=Carex littledalei TaxID=544730 RepID=A0A833QBY5_9POAL|nr:Uridine kinase-like protein 1 [Carex littledalei]
MQIRGMHTLIRDKDITTPDFVFYSDRLIRLAPEGIHTVCKRFPAVKIVTSEIDGGLNEEYRVIPGLGEFGDRYYFGTDN